jgi:predicted ATPase/class 3 adenylate cyclase
MAELPTGTVTFLFTDVEGSSRLWEAHPDAMQSALARHDEIVRSAIEAHEGYVVKTTGDGFHAAFATASDAVAAAVDAQLGLESESWPDTDPIRVRIGVHTGAAEIRDGDYYGPALNRAARLMDAGHGGQVLVSGATAELTRGTGVELVDLGSHQLRDLGDPERVFQVLHPALTSEFAPLRTFDAFATNLPLQVTTFVARDDEVADIKEALTQSRLVTLIGVGGVGKTRLAVQSAAEVLPHYRDGVWLCELGPLNDGEQVPNAVANAMNVRQRPGQSITESLVSTLRSKEMLVVVDNCEHLLDASAQLVAAIVGSCPAITVLATGREGLGVRGERMMMVRSLPLPAADATTDAILATDAVQLFNERAEQAGGAVDLDDDTVSTLAQLCRRLDGIPLAIELAAARTRMMSPHEITARLDERFRLLTGGSRTAVERHQTLRRAVEWSYDLLDERERTVLDRLGVFAGGFTLEAAEAVVSGDDIDAFDVLDSIAQLVDKSLVEPEREQQGTRYRLLETIRTYALERLDDRDATDATRRRHATWCAEFVAHASVGVHGPDEAAWLERLDREFDNVRAALTWATDADDADLSLSLIGTFGLWHLYSRRLGYMLAPWAAAALAATGAADDPRFAPVLAIRALDHFNHQRLDDAERDARRALELMTNPGIPFSANPWAILWFALTTSGRADEIEGFDAFVEDARATGDDYTLAGALAYVAGMWDVLANLERYLSFAEEATLIAQRIGNPTLITLSGSFLGAALEATDPPRARSVLETAIEHGTTVEVGSHLAMALAYLARISPDTMDAQWATQFRSILDIPYEAGDTRYVLMYLDMYTQALAKTDRAESATKLNAAVAALGPHLSNPISVAHRRDTNGRLLAQLGEEHFAELTAQAANLGYEATVALAFAELDRAIATGERQISNA